MFKNFRSLSKLLLVRPLSSQPIQNVLEHLKDRSLIRVSGTEVSDFIQGLITNDIKHLENGPGSMFTMFLNTKGRVLYDAIIYRTDEDNALLIECDKEGSETLQKHLKMFRVRRKIDINDMQGDYKVNALFNTAHVNFLNENKHKSSTNEFIVPCDKLNETLPKTSTKFYKDIMIFKDPRITSLGSRIISKVDVNVEEQLKDIVEIGTQKVSYRWFRYSLGIGEGIKDLPYANSFPLEVNCDYLHGVSFHKGCYIGQELTARTYHTGVIRKRLMPLHFVQLPTQNINEEAIIHENTNLGKLRGIEGNVGLALLRIAKALDYGEIKIGDGLAKVIKPSWWPIEASKEKISVQKS